MSSLASLFLTNGANKDCGGEKLTSLPKRPGWRRVSVSRGGLTNCAASATTTIPNHSTGKTRFTKNVWREEIRLAVSAARMLLLALLRSADDGTAAGRRTPALRMIGLIELIAHEPAYRNIAHRNQQHAEQRRTQHPADHPGADGVARVGART